MTTLPATFTVTADHIKSGICGDGCECPVARAIAEAIAGTDAGVWVFETEIRLMRSFGVLCWRAAVPPAVREFIVAFDDGNHVAPFTFELTWEAAS